MEETITNETVNQLTQPLHQFLSGAIQASVDTGRDGDPSNPSSMQSQQRSQKLASRVLCNGRTSLGGRYPRIAVLEGVLRSTESPVRLPDAIQCDLNRYGTHWKHLYIKETDRGRTMEEPNARVVCDESKRSGMH